MSRTVTEEHETVITLLADRASGLGDRPLVHTADRTYSYRDLHRDSNAIANTLVDRGIEPGERICTLLENSPEYLATWFGIAKAGAVMVPLNDDLRDEGLAYVLRDSTATTIVLDAPTRANYETVRGDDNDVETAFLLGESPRGAPYRPFEELLDGDRGARPDRSRRGSDPLSIIYTSGTTGKPKGVILPHYSYLNTGREYVEKLSVGAEDRLFTTLPLSHCNAQQTTVAGSILATTDFALYAEFDPDRFWNQIRRHGATVFNYIGTMITNLRNADARPDDTDNPAVYGIGADAPPGAIEEFEPRFDVQLLEGYGLTETATMATLNPVDEPRRGSIGKPLSYIEMEIVDEEDRPLPPGEEGEIVVRPTEPNSFMLGYHEKAEETVDAWQNLWFHTGGIQGRGRLLLLRRPEGVRHPAAGQQRLLARGRERPQRPPGPEGGRGVRRPGRAGRRGGEGGRRPEAGTDADAGQHRRLLRREARLLQDPAVHRHPRGATEDVDRTGEKVRTDRGAKRRRLGPRERLRTQAVSHGLRAPASRRRRGRPRPCSTRRRRW